MMEPPTPNTEEGQRGRLVVAVLLVVNPIATLFLFLRLFVRIKLSINFGRDDITIVIGWIIAVAVVVANFVSIYAYGVGKHILYVTSAQLIQVNKWSLISEILIIFSNLFVKYSIGLSLLRIFTTKKRRKWVIYAVLSFITLTSISAAISIFCECRPIEKSFDPRIIGSCYGDQVRLDMAYYQGISSVMCDAMLAVLPTVFLWDLQIKLKVKIGICCVLGLGLLTAACAIVRVMLLGNPGAVDFTYWLADVYIWSDLELTVAIVAASIPTLRPLWTSFVEKYRSYLPRRRSGYNIHLEDQNSPKRVTDHFNRRTPTSGTNSLSNTLNHNIIPASPERVSENTLMNDPYQGHNTIRKTTEFHMDFNGLPNLADARHKDFLSEFNAV